MKIFLIFAFSTLLTAQSTPEIVPVDQEPMHILTFENEYVRVFVVTVPVNSQTKFHQHDRDYMFVTLGDSEVESERVNEKPVRLSLKDGEARFTKGGFAHKAVNLSDKPFRNVTVEFKGRVNDSPKFQDHFYGRTGHSAVLFLDDENVKCGYYSGPAGSRERVEQRPTLVIRPDGQGAKPSERVEINAKEDAQHSLISFYRAGEVPLLFGGGKERSVFTACTFTPVKNQN